MTRLVAASAFLLLHALAAQPAEVSVSMVYSNATSGAQPYVLFEGKEWRAHERARFVKLHVYFDQGIPLTGFDLVPCKPDPAQSELSFFINFDQLMFPSAAAQKAEAEAEQGLREAMRAKRKPQRAKPKAGEPEPEEEAESEDEDYVVTDGKARFNIRLARALTVNFERKRGVRVCGITP